MTTRLSRRAAVAVGLSIVAMMLVWAPMGALADSGNSNAPTEAPGNSANAPGQADGTAPGNSENAPGQAADTETVTTTDAAPGNSGSAHGQNKTDPGPPPNSNAGGNSDSSSNAGGSNGHNGNNVPADNLDDGKGGGVGNSENQDKDRPSDASNGPGTGQEPATSCPNDKKGGDDTGHGANQGTVYDSTCDGRPSDNGQGGGNATGRPCMGCVGNADDKNPGANNGKGQYPGPKNDRKNRGHECDDNNGIGKGNPAHTGCTTGGSSDVDVCRLVQGVWTKVYDTQSQAGDKALSAIECNPPEKVWICHVNSGVNNYVVINVNKNSKQDDNGNGHAGHAGDVTLSATTKDAAEAEAAIDCVDPLEVTVCSGSGTTWTSAVILKSVYDANPGNYVLWTGNAADCYDPPKVTVCSGSGTTWTSAVILKSVYDANPGNYVLWTGSAADCFTRVLDCPENGTPCPSSLDCPENGIPCPDDSDDPCPPGTDHAGEFVTVCDDDDVLGNTLCPNGTVMPASGECNESVLPDFVLGIRLNQDPVAPAVLPNTLHAAPEGVAGAVLPFTGGSLLPFVMVSLATLSVGAASLIRRKK